MFDMIGKVTLKQYDCLTYSSYSIVVINYLQTLTDLGNFDSFLLLQISQNRFLKI